MARGSRRRRTERRRLGAAIALRHLPVARSVGSLLGLNATCSHRHRRRHRVDLAGDLRLRRLHRLRCLHRWHRLGEVACAPPDLACQYLLHDGVVGLLQERSDLGRNRRVGRQDRVQVGAGGGDPLKIVGRGEPTDRRGRVVVPGRW